ncbi:MAG: flagellar basal body rod protein FlgF [Pseudomonadales bacterium]|nr:flagellar basal body rod protein FlgF [Pseudomonadales bacterium]
MDKMLYVAMSGAKQTMLAQNVHSHNLANVATTGFKADYAQARSMPVFGGDFPTRVYSMTENPGVNFEPGNMIATNRDLDISVQGEGWLTVLDSEGNEAFTRSGELVVDANGLVKTRDNLILMGNAGPLVLPPYEKLEIGGDGTITVQSLGQGPETLTEVDRMKLVNPEVRELTKGADGMFRRKDGNIEPPDSVVRVQSGVLEGSNVNPVEALMEIMSLSRQFELQMKMMTKAEELDENSARLLQGS